MVFGRFRRPTAQQANRDVAKAEVASTKWFKAESEDDWDLVDGAVQATIDDDEACPLTDVTAALVIDDGYLLVGEQTALTPAVEVIDSGPATEAPSSADGADPGASAEEDAVPDSDSGSESPLQIRRNVGDMEPTQPGEPADLVEPAAETATATEPAASEAAAAATAAPAASHQEEVKENEDGYLCGSCDNPIFKEEDILSSNYHAMTGPGYLTSAANNVSISLEMQTQLYTTGKYTVREVSCSCCGSILGVTYAGAADARNRYKVGKFLIGRDRLCLPDGKVHPMEAEG
mmetsp:Transcript_32677/g.74110  ORF Transcript_32677/g.74110 Transcript_32677/m.74110 type:complete len:290 (+) Transcript_32677:121-990(+)